MNKFFGVSIASLFLVCSGAFGQGTTSRIVGTVSDTTGAVIPGAEVKLTNSASGVQPAAVHGVVGAEYLLERGDQHG